MHKEEEDPKTMEECEPKSNTLSRRAFLKYAGITGAAITVSGGLGGLLAACGGDEETTTTAAPTETTAWRERPQRPRQARPRRRSPPARNRPLVDKIVIGAARPVSGALSSFEEANFGPAYKLWVEDVNDAGGIKVAGKPLPVEMMVYDDQSDLDTSMRLLTKLIDEDKVNFVFAPCSTAFLFAAAGVANDKKYILLSSEGGATSLEQEMKNLPYFFQCLNYSNHAQMPMFADVLTEAGAKTVSIVYLDDLHGIEYQAQAQVYLSAAGIEILSNTAIPGDIKDMSSIVKKMQEENPDVVCSFAYPPHNILFLQTMMQLGFNPKGVAHGPGWCQPVVLRLVRRRAGRCDVRRRVEHQQHPRVQGLLRQPQRLPGRPAEHRLLGCHHLPGAVGVLPAGHRTGRHAGSGQDRRGHADGALQDDHDPGLLLRPTRSSTSLPTPARSASGRRASPRSST